MTLRNLLVTALQFIFFLVVIAVGSFLRPLHIQTVFGQTGLVTRIFVWDGLLVAAALLVLVLLAELLAKRLRSAAPWSALAFLLATGVGLALKLGFITRDF